MFRALGRLFRALGFLMIGKFDKASEAISANPQVVKARYSEVIREKKHRLDQLMDAVASLVAEREKKKARVKKLTEEINRLEKLKAGAANKAKAVKTKLLDAGKSVEDIKADPEFQKCQAFFQDFSSTLQAKQEDVAELENSIEAATKTIEKHKINLERLQKEIGELKTEAADAVADIISAQEEEKIAKTLAGIANDGTAAELESLRDLRAKTKAKATVASEMAGIDSAVTEEEFLAAATNDAADEEFMDLIGGLEEKPKKKTSRKKTVDREQLPE